MYWEMQELYTYIGLRYEILKVYSFPLIFNWRGNSPAVYQQASVLVQSKDSYQECISFICQLEENLKHLLHKTKKTEARKYVRTVPQAAK